MSEPFIFKVVLRNRSRFPIDIVWENARDLEHVAVLHRRTNVSFQMIDFDPDPTGGHPYLAMTFRVRRRLLGFLQTSNFGRRRIAGDYEIHQIDFNPLFGVTTFLRSRLERCEDNPGETWMIDEVRIRMPRWLSPLRGLFESALRRHTRIQCAEDEPFRERRVELARRGIRLPLSLLNAPLWNRGFPATRER